MINKDKLLVALGKYKEYFKDHFKDEVYKWKAVKHFQDNWDIDASDFGKMFDEATKNTYNLLASSYNYPKKMILEFSQVAPEDVREMFMELFDESIDLSMRIDNFIMKSDRIMKSYFDDTAWKNHYQNTNTISTYLWLRYPDKYYIYKYSTAKEVAKEFESEFIPKRSASADNIVRLYELFDSINHFIRQDDELKVMLENSLPDDAYDDPNLITMTVDFDYYVGKVYSSIIDEAEWIPKDYSPNITVEQWVDLLEDKNIFTKESLEVMKRFKDYGGEATCSQIATKYGYSPGFYNLTSTKLAKRIIDNTDCDVYKAADGAVERWPILYTGKMASKDQKGVFIWRLRDELSKALDKVDLSDISLYVKEGDEEYGDVNYWWLNANPKIWSFSKLRVGGIIDYTIYNENGNKRRIFQNFLDAKAGDFVIGYESHPVKKVVSLGKISEEQDGEKISIEKLETFENPLEYKILKEIPELQNMEYFVNPQGSLFKLSKGEYEFIMDMIRESNPKPEPIDTLETYTKKEFLDEVYMSDDSYETLKSLLDNKYNIILQGAPGVGKTYADKRLAYSLMGVKDSSRIEMIQFHQNYSYEDFIMGYKPFDDGFELTEGVFYKFCKRASDHPDEPFFFIIDEINRGNMSKIFGELLMLIEKDYRDTEITLAYNGIKFSVPGNIRIIGMMNTADRSLAMIDYALRRRFSFFDMEPGFDSGGFKIYQEGLDNEMFDDLIEKVKHLNRDIGNDDSLGSGFQIGHSYFCDRKVCTEEWMKEVVYYEIIPMLREYWFDDSQKVKSWENQLSGVLNG